MTTVYCITECCYLLFSYRHGVLTSDDLVEEYGDDVHFLLARLKMISEAKDVSFLSCVY